MRFGTVQQDSITYTSAISGMGGTNWNLALVPCLCFDCVARGSSGFVNIDL